MKDPQEHISVVTGDLVQSTALPKGAIDRAMASLSDASDKLGALQGQSLRFTRHRGDGWQAVLVKPDLYLRAALAFRANLKALGDAYDTYIAIADGPQETALPGDLNSAQGPAFVKSGDALDAMKLLAGNRGRFAHAGFGQQAATLALADRISQGWTPAQSAAVAQMIFHPAPPTLTSVAEALGISRQAATKSLDAAGYDFIQEAMNHVEKDKP